MEVRVNDDDLRRVIQQMAIEKANDQATIAALSRTITEMEMAQAAQKEPKAKTK